MNFKNLLVDKTLYAIVMSTRFILKLIPNFIRKLFLKMVAKAFYLFDKKHRHIVEANLRFAFPSMDEIKIKLTTKQVFDNFAFYLGDFLLSNSRTTAQLEKIVEIENDHYMTDAIKANKNIIAISAHFGNWEIISKTIGAFYSPIVGVGQKLYRSPSLDQKLTEYRERFNMEMLPREGAMKGLVRSLKQGKVVGMIVDQNTTDSEGVLIDFFDKKARHTDSAARLARKFNAVIIPVFTYSDTHETHVVKFFPPFFCAKTDDEEQDILQCAQEQAKCEEAIIRAHPSQYFWLHRRFKSQYSHIYC